MELIYVAKDHLFETNFIYYIEISDILAPNYINEKQHRNILKHINIIYVSLRRNNIRISNRSNKYNILHFLNGINIFFVLFFFVLR